LRHELIDCLPFKEMLPGSRSRAIVAVGMIIGLLAAAAAAIVLTKITSPVRFAIAQTLAAGFICPLVFLLIYRFLTPVPEPNPIAPDFSTQIAWTSLAPHALRVVAAGLVCTGGILVSARFLCPATRLYSSSKEPFILEKTLFKIMELAIYIIHFAAFMVTFIPAIISSSYDIQKVFSYNPGLGVLCVWSVFAVFLLKIGIKRLFRVRIAVFETIFYLTVICIYLFTIVSTLPESFPILLQVLGFLRFYFPQGGIATYYPYEDLAFFAALYFICLSTVIYSFYRIKALYKDNLKRSNA